MPLYQDLRKLSRHGFNFSLFLMNRKEKCLILASLFCKDSQKLYILRKEFQRPLLQWDFAIISIITGHEVKEREKRCRAAVKAPLRRCALY